ARKERGGFGFGPPGAAQPGSDLRTFVQKRSDSVEAQLEGKSKGFVPGMGFGPGGPGGLGGPGGRGGPGGFAGPPQPGQIMAPFLQDALRLTAEQKKQMEELQKEVDAKVAKILTDAQKKQMKDMQQGFGRGGPGGFGP